LSSDKAPKPSKIGYAVVLAVIMFLVLALIYLWAPSIQPSAAKLVIEAPLEAKVGSTIAVTVKAVDEEGRVDKTRNDIVEVSITPEGLTDSSKIKIRLEEGEATISFTVKASGKAVIQAKWIQGYSFLKTGSTNIEFT